MRNELLQEQAWLQADCKVRKIQLSKDVSIKIPESGEYPGITYATWKDAYSKIQSYLKLENIYVLEMWRLYNLTGIEKLKYHVVQTTPVIQKLLWRFHTKNSTAWLNLRRSYGKMVHAEVSPESLQARTVDLGPIGSPVLFSKEKLAIKRRGAQGVEVPVEAVVVDSVEAAVVEDEAAEPVVVEEVKPVVAEEVKAAGVDEEVKQEVQEKQLGN